MVSREIFRGFRVATEGARLEVSTQDRPTPARGANRAFFSLLARARRARSATNTP